MTLAEIFPARGYPTLVNQHHLGRTLLDLQRFVDVEFPRDDLLERRDLGEWPDEPHFALLHFAQAASVTIGGDHLVLHLESGQHSPRELRQHARHAIELYDLRTDPSCTVDRSATDPGRARELRAMLIDWLKQQPEPRWSGVETADPENVTELRRLGYVSGEPSQGQAALWEDDGGAWCQRYEGR